MEEGKHYFLCLHHHHSLVKHTQSLEHIERVFFIIPKEIIKSKKMLALNQTTSSSGIGQRNKFGGASSGGGVGGRRGNISGSTSLGSSGSSQHAASRSHHQKLLQLIEFIKLETNKDKLNHYLSQVEDILVNNTDRYVHWVLLY